VKELLDAYLVDVCFGGVSGAEHMQMLQTRDRVAANEPSLSPDERALLYEADRRLVENAAAFHAELARFLDLKLYRDKNHIEPARWWWYLDVISQIPLENTPPLTRTSPG
jgi:hypothetical protein